MQSPGWVEPKRTVAARGTHPMVSPVAATDAVAIATSPRAAPGVAVARRPGAIARKIGFVGAAPEAEAFR